MSTISPVENKSAEKVKEPKINPIGIRKLNPAQIEKLLFPKIPQDQVPLNNLIQAIIKSENAIRRSKATNKKKVISEVTPIHYKEENQQWDPTAHQGFIHSAYFIQSKGLSELGRVHKEQGATDNLKVKRNQYLDFFYREMPREIYVLTSDHTWEIVRRYTDYSWPQSFCRHFLDSDRIAHITRESIFGDERKEEITYSCNQRLELLEGRDRIYCKIVLPFRKDATIYDLDPFKTPTGKKLQHDISVTIQTGQIRLHRRLELKDFPLFLDHTSTTLRKKISENIRKKFEILDYLEKIEDPDLRNQLELTILDQLANSIRKKDGANYSFCPKFLSDYTNTIETSLILLYEKNKIELTRYSTLNEILIRLRLAFPSGSIAELIKELKKVKVKHDDKIFSFVDCIEGEIHLEHKAYFRINKCFYSLSGDYLTLVHLDFRRSLSELLIREKDKGDLPHAWGGQHPHGNLTNKKLKDSDCNEKIAELEKREVAYLELINIQIKIVFNQLKGEILKNNLVSAHRKEIENLLGKRKFLTRDSLETELKITKEGAQEIWGELTKKRKIFIKKDNKYFVINPLVKEAELSNVLDTACFEYYARETEGHYNEQYLYDKSNNGKPYGEKEGFLVGDRVCPFGIEIFDIVRYTHDITYIYHVKEGFDLHARDALSQLMNAVEMIYEAKQANGETNVLDKWFELASKPKKDKIKPEDRSYRDKLAIQVNHLGLEGFKDIFLKRKLVFVYAVLDSHSQELTLNREIELKESFNANDFEQMIKTADKTKITAPKIMKKLITEGFLDTNARLTSKFYGTPQTKFTDDFPLDIPNAAKERIYQKLAEQASQFNSTIALLELRRARKRVERFNCEFKVCQIKRAAYESSQPFFQSQGINLLDQLSQHTLEKPTFEYEKSKYNRGKDTRADGACALHALLGNVLNEEWVFLPKEAEGDKVGENAKKDFLSKLKSNKEFQELFIDCLYDFALTHKLELHTAYQESMEPIMNNISQSKNALIKIYQNALSSDLYSCLFPHLQGTKDKYVKKSKEELRTILLKDEIQCFNAFSACSESINSILKGSNEFEKATATLNSKQEEFEKQRARFFTSEENMTQYEEILLKSYYHLSDKELELAAYLYDKKVILFSEGQEPQILNKEAKESVFIEHEGDHTYGHYSRLSKLRKEK